MVDHYVAETVVPAGAQVGEGPRWDAERQQLIWVDITGRAVHLTDPITGDDQVQPLATFIGAAAIRTNGEYLLAVSGGLATWRPGTVPAPVAALEADQPERRPNDAAVDPAGRLLVGTVSITESPDRVGSLYQIQPDFTAAQLFGGLGLPNGTDWSPDGHTLYFTDSLDKSVGVFDYHPDSGTLGPRRGSLPIEQGLPDGHTVDAEGNIWVAQWSAGTVAAYTPTGRLLATVQLPVATVTACAFGGAGLDTLFITTMQERSDASGTPHAGDLFACQVKAVGKLPTRFRG